MFGPKQNYSSKHLDQTSTGPGSEQLRHLNSLLVSSGSITLVGEEKICLLSFTCNYVVSVRRGFLFLWVLEMRCVILLWHI